MADTNSPRLSYFDSLLHANQNCQLNFATTILQGLGQGVYLLVFNLYILAVGIDADALGVILSAAPLAQAIGSIPIGMLAERIGFRKTFVIIYAVTGLARLLQASSDNITAIGGVAFFSGLALAGDFVVRIAFLAANSRPEERTQIYSFSSFLFSFSLAIGSLVAGFIPNLFLTHSLDLALAYRYTLYVAGALTLLGVVPSLLVTEASQAADRHHRTGLAPYLWGMDHFTRQHGLISLFVGLTIGMTVPFMNIYFIYNLGSSREFFGVASALALAFTMVGTAVAPFVAARVGWVRSVTNLRLLVPVAILAFAFTSSQYFGAVAYLAQYVLIQMSQPLSFAFAMYFATVQARTAVSAWLNVTFWLGNALAAPITGHFLAMTDYRSPLLIAAVTIIVAAGLNRRFFNRLELTIPMSVRSGDPLPAKEKGLPK